MLGRPTAPLLLQVGLAGGDRKRLQGKTSSLLFSVWERAQRRGRAGRWQVIAVVTTEEAGEVNLRERAARTPSSVTPGEGQPPSVRTTATPPTTAVVARPELRGQLLQVARGSGPPGHLLRTKPFLEIQETADCISLPFSSSSFPLEQVGWKNRGPNLLWRMSQDTCLIKVCFNWTGNASSPQTICLKVLPLSSE